MIERLCDYKGLAEDLALDPCLNRSPATGATTAATVPCESSKAALVAEARVLLSAVTRVLLLADTVVVRQLILAKDKVSFSALELSCHLSTVSPCRRCTRIDMDFFSLHHVVPLLRCYQHAPFSYFTDGSYCSSSTPIR
jgi:hypothetical protein